MKSEVRNIVTYFEFKNLESNHHPQYKIPRINVTVVIIQTKVALPFSDFNQNFSGNKLIPAPSPC